MGIVWSEDEVKLLKKLFPQGRAREIAKRTGRPLTAVRQKAYHMGIRTSEHRLWSAGEIRHLKRLYPSEDVQSIADKLGRSYDAVAVKARKLEICRQHNVWSKRELNLLKKLHPNKTARETAEQIGRSVRAIRRGIQRFGLQKGVGYEECHRVVNGTKEKLCCRCNLWKKESLFHRNRSRMTVHSCKTEHHESGEFRLVPIFPELMPYLFDAYERAEPGTEYAVTRYRKPGLNLRSADL